MSKNIVKSYNREQLVEFCDIVLSSAMDRIATCLPDCIPLSEYEEDELGLSCFIDGCIQSAGMNLAVLYAQYTGEGMGTEDGLYYIDFYDFVDNFKNERLDKNFTGLKPGDQCTPVCRHLAEKFVDLMLSDSKDVFMENPKANCDFPNIFLPTT